MIKTALFAAAAALATVATAAPVLAKDVPVRYGDLNLASVEGQKALSHRIDRAARQACEFSREPGIRSRDAVACYKQAHTKARTEMAAVVEDSRLGG
jgi:UrcA family protein